MFLGDFGDGNGWIYVDGTSRIEVAYMSERASEILILTTWQAPKGLHTLITLNAHKQ